MRPARPAQSDLPRMLAPVILGSDFCCYSYIRCFWEAYGVKPIVLASADIKSVRSRFCDYRVIPGIDRPEVCLPELERLGDELIAAGKIPFLVGCGDHYARLVSENKPQIEERWYTPYLDFELLDDITQKERFYEICEEIGVPYPKTVYLDCGDKTATVDDGGFMYPVIAKPSNSAAWHYAEFEGQQKVYLIHSREQLEALYKQLQETTYDKLLIVQEFIPGDDTQIRILSSYLDAAGDPVFMVGGRVMVEDHSPTAIGNPAVIVSEQLDAVSDDALRFMRHVGYRGMANFDVKYDERDGTYKFFEINTRPGRSSDFVRQAGINFAQVQVDDVLMGEKRPRISNTKPFIYTTVPPYVVKRSIDDAAIRRQVLDGFRTGLTHYALDWDEDCMGQRFWSKVTYYHQIDKFRKYFWGDGAKNLA
ncbi:carboxylate--amine ligase [Collinsella sp.]|uniref:carboxylate--amine ligase n=1 Tax=Collinsella sp. TaxID=1965294 RepID=UPI003FF09656